MIKNGIAAAVALAATLLAPSAAHADLILNTGTPPGPPTPSLTIGTNQSGAVEFSLTAGETISQLSAYLNAGSSTPPVSFEFVIYSNSNFLNVRPSNLGSGLYQDLATFTTNGWTSAAANYTAPSTGLYWLVVETSATPGLNLPEETSAGSNVFAYENSAGTSGKYTTSGAVPFGVQISTPSAVPLPAAAGLLLSGLTGLGFLRRKPAAVPRAAA